jgi:hypothetical protein
MRYERAKRTLNYRSWEGDKGESVQQSMSEIASYAAATFPLPLQLPSE